jgi:hypothetical protein
MLNSNHTDTQYAITALALALFYVANKDQNLKICTKPQSSKGLGYLPFMEETEFESPFALTSFLRTILAVTTG